MEKEVAKEVSLPYVVVEVGYEGIERILWATVDGDEAARIVREIREFVREVRGFYEIREKGLNDAEEMEEEIEMEEEEKAKAVIEKFKDRDLFYRKVIESARFVDPDRICVQRFDVQSGDFRCFCEELGLSVGRLILY